MPTGEGVRDNRALMYSFHTDTGYLYYDGVRPTPLFTVYGGVVTSLWVELPCHDRGHQLEELVTPFGGVALATPTRISAKRPLGPAHIGIRTGHAHLNAALTLVERGRGFKA